MSLRLVTGPPLSGKSAFADDCLAESARARRDAILLVPTYAEVVDRRRRLAARAPLGINVTTFERWCDQHWGLRGDGRRVVTGRLRQELSNRAVAEVTAGEGGSGLGRIVAELVSADSADPTGDSLPARVVRRYREILRESGLIERNEAVASLRNTPTGMSGCVVVDSYRDLSEWELQMIERLAIDCDVTVVLPYEDDSPVSRFLDSTVQRLAAAGDRVRLRPTEAREELNTLRAQLFAGGDDPVIPTGEVQFGVASGDEAELSLVARAAREQIDQGVEPWRVGVVFRRLASRAHRLAAALAAEGVQTEFDVRIPLGRTALGGALLALMRVCLGRGDRTDLLAFLLSPYSGALPADVQRLDVAWRRRREGDFRVLLKEASALAAPTRRSIEAARAFCTSSADTISDEQARHFARLLGVMLASGSERDGLTGFHASEDAAAHAAAMAAVGDAAGLTSLGTAADVIRALNGAVVSPGAQPRADAVLVMEASNLRPESFDVLMIGGLNADGFGAIDGGSSAEVASRLKMSAPPDAVAAERLLFCLTVSRARKRLILTRAATSGEGESRRASAFWDDVLDRYRGALNAEEAAEFPEGVPVRRLRLTDLSDSAPQMTVGRRWTRSSVSEQARATRGMLESDEALAALASRDEFSVTELENYLSCPYRWFYQRVVAPREIDRELGVREIGAYSHELLAAFYRTRQERARRERGTTRVTEDGIEDARALVDEIADELARQGATRPQSLAEEFSLAAAVESVKALVSDDATYLPGWTPTAVEWSFGRDSEATLSLGGVALAGRVDRVDTDGHNVAVTDYKLGGGHPGHESFDSRGVLQPVVYSLAAAAAFGGQPAAALYRSLSNLEARGFWRSDLLSQPEKGKAKDAIDGDSWAELIARTEADIGSAVAGIRAGAIDPRPKDKKACMYCSASAVCESAR